MLTDYLKIATAAPTIDGREIKAEWLESMAKTYDRTVYVAGINVEHYADFGLGDVFDLRFAEDEEGRPALYARLDARAQLLQWQQDGYKPFFSVEIKHDYPKKDEAYLTGLAVTGFPASIGLQPAKFSRTEVQTFSQKIPWQMTKDGGVLTGNHPQVNALPAGHGTQAQESMAAALWNTVMNMLKPNQPQETEPMTKEEAAKFEALENQVKEMKAKLEAFDAATAQAQPAAATAADTVAASAGDGAEAAKAAEAKAGDAQNYSAVLGAVIALSAKLDAMAANFAAPVNADKFAAPVSGAGTGGIVA